MQTDNLSIILGRRAYNLLSSDDDLIIELEKRIGSGWTPDRIQARVYNETRNGEFAALCKGAAVYIASRQVSMAEKQEVTR